MVDLGDHEGVGALNARSEVMLVTRPLGEAPVGFQCRAPDVIRIMRGRRIVHVARYPSLVFDAARSRSPVMVSEVAQGGQVTRVSRLSRTEARA